MSASSLERTLKRLANAPEAAVRDACKEIREIARQEGGSVTAGRNRKRYQLDLVTRITKSGTKVTAIGWGIPTGFWVWKNTGTQGPYPIPKKLAKRYKPGREIYAPGYAHPVRQVQHPGIRPRYKWRRVVKRADGVVDKALVQHVRWAIRG